MIAQAQFTIADLSDAAAEVIVGTQTASTAAWKGNASFSELKDGQTILYWLPYAGTSSNATLNLTLADGTATGAVDGLVSPLSEGLLGSNVVRTTAKLTTLDKRGADGNLIGVDDNAFCIYEMADGTVGTMTASWTYYAAEDNSTVLYGTEGEMRIYDDPAHSIVLKKKGEEPKFFDVEQIQTNDNQTKSGIIDLWVDCLMEGKESPISGASVLSAMRAVFASMESSETGRAVDIPANR